MSDTGVSIDDFDIEIDLVAIVNWWNFWINAPNKPRLSHSMKSNID